MQSIKSISLLDHLNFFSPPTSVLTYPPFFLTISYLCFGYLVTQLFQHSRRKQEAKQKQEINMHFKGICFDDASSWVLAHCVFHCCFPGRVEEHCAVCDCALGDELLMMCQSLKTSTQKL